MDSETQEVEACADRRAATRWLALALGVLIPAGLFALLIVVARTPPFARWVTDPMFFRRCLVVHVDLALLIWSYAFVAALFFLLPSKSRPHPLSRGLGVGIATAGVVALVLGAAVPGAVPLLTNYVPTIDHRVFNVGLLAFAFGLTLTFLDARLLPRNEVANSWMDIPDAARPGIRAAVLAILIAFVTFGLAAAVTPPGLAPQTRNELMFWGGGHILQVALEAAMLAVWIILLAPVLGESPLSRPVAAILFGALVIPTLIAPVLTARGTTSGLYRGGFTTLMQWGIFPVTAVMLALCVRGLVRANRCGRPWRALMSDPRVIGFTTSAALTTVAFVLGAMIRGSTTLVPAHYHAATGAVTVSFMAMTYVLLERLGLSSTSRPMLALRQWQPLAYGGGQLLFAIGFGIAGAHGMARKAYGQEQHIRGTGDYVGLSLMGLGGLVAVIGGVLFLLVVVSAWRNRAHTATHTSRRSTWTTTPESIHSSG